MTIQKLHSILRRAGFERSKRLTSMVRGWATMTEGYSIFYSQQWKIHYEWGETGKPYIERKRAEVAALNGYVDAIRAAGFEAHIAGDLVIVSKE